MRSTVESTVLEFDDENRISTTCQLIGLAPASSFFNLVKPEVTYQEGPLMLFVMLVMQKNVCMNVEQI